LGRSRRVERLPIGYGMLRTLLASAPPLPLPFQHGHSGARPLDTKCPHRRDPCFDSPARARVKHVRGGFSPRRLLTTTGITASQRIGFGEIAMRQSGTVWAGSWFIPCLLSLLVTFFEGGLGQTCQSPDPIHQSNEGGLVRCLAKFGLIRGLFPFSFLFYRRKGEEEDVCHALTSIVTSHSLFLSVSCI